VTSLLSNFGPIPWCLKGPEIEHSNAIDNTHFTLPHHHYVLQIQVIVSAIWLPIVFDYSKHCHADDGDSSRCLYVCIYAAIKAFAYEADVSRGVSDVFKNEASGTVVDIQYGMNSTRCLPVDYPI
jgi:hypothetical protein